MQFASPEAVAAAQPKGPDYVGNPSVYGPNAPKPIYTEDEQNALTQWYANGGAAGAEAVPEEDPAAAGGGGGGGGGYDLNAQLAGIQQAYQQQLDNLAKNRDAAMASLGQSHGQAKGAIGTQRADFGQQAGVVDEAIRTQYAQTRLAQEANVAQAQKENAAFGLQNTGMAQTIAQGDSWLNQQQQLQSSLGVRLSQVQDADFAGKLSTTDQIKQAGEAQTALNYDAFKGKLDLAKMEQEASANAAYSSSLRSGASTGSDGLTAYQRAQLEFDYYKENNRREEYASKGTGGKYDMNDLEEGSVAWEAAFQGNLKDSQQWLNDALEAGNITPDEAKDALLQLGQSATGATKAKKANAVDPLQSALAKMSTVKKK
jgi:hypothetical protein